MQIRDHESMTQLQVARAFAVSARTVRSWSTEFDCPRSQDGTYNLTSVIAWRLRIEGDRAAEATAADTDGAEALQRFRMARAKIAELDLQERRGELVHASAVRSGAARAGQAFAAAVRGIGPRCAPVVAGMDDAVECDEEISRVAEEIISDLHSNMGAIVRGEG